MHSCHASRIFSLQRRAVRIIAGLGYRDDVRQSFIDLRILTLPCRYIYECLLYCHGNQERYICNGSNHSYPTRQWNSIRPTFLRLEKSRISVNYYAPLFNNKLPNEYKLLAENLFKVKMKDFLTRGAFYSIAEFSQWNF